MNTEYGRGGSRAANKTKKADKLVCTGLASVRDADPASGFLSDLLLQAHDRHHRGL